MPQAERVGQEQSAYGWVIVFAGLLISLCMYGVIESFAIMFKPIAEQFFLGSGHGFGRVDD